jgi:hypothetical protein
MTYAAKYRHLAKDARERASKEASANFRAEWLNLAERYIQLAQSEQNRLTYAHSDPIRRILSGAQHLPGKKA